MGRIQTLKQYLERSHPNLLLTYRSIRRTLANQTLSLESSFSKIYHNGGWGDPESLSGGGSNLSQTTKIRQVLPKLFKELEVKTLLDAPCGDFYWMKEINLDLDLYIGLDIVPEIITHNSKYFAASNRIFQVTDITKTALPQADLILCRDCLIHLSFRHCFAALKNFKKSGSRYLLTTTNVNLAENYDIISGSFRPLNLMAKPFNFPPPLKLIEDGCDRETSVDYDRRLGLWDLKTLNI